MIDSAVDRPQIATFAGTGVAGVGISPSVANFGYVPVNTTSAAKTITVKNNLAVNLNFTSISAPSPFAIVSGTTTCVVGTPVTPGSSCFINLTYSPTSPSAAPASTLTLTDDGPSSPQAVNLIGSGITPVVLSPAGLNFGKVILNVASVDSLTLTNKQSGPLKISSITGYPAGYSLNSAGTTCPFAPNTVPAGGSCVIAFSLTATVAGGQPGTISINDDASNSPQAVAVNANAYPPMTYTPSSLLFTGQSVGTASAPQTITLTNQQSTQS